MQHSPCGGDGYFADMNDRAAETGRTMAEAGGVELDEDQYGMFKMWRTEPIKLTTSSGGLAKPAGCVCVEE